MPAENFADFILRFLPGFSHVCSLFQQGYPVSRSAAVICSFNDAVAERKIGDTIEWNGRGFCYFTCGDAAASQKCGLCFPFTASDSFHLFFGIKEKNVFKENDFLHAGFIFMLPGFKYRNGKSIAGG